jgi:hypothetical protein
MTTQYEQSDEPVEATTPDDRPAEHAAQVGERAAEGDPSADERAPLFAADEAERLRARWAEVQGGFVDEPREMVEQADQLVGELMQQLTAGFAERRSQLERRWSEGDEVSTEDLRVALTRYRSFFDRLLSA